MSAATMRIKYRQSRWMGIGYLALLCVFLFIAIFHTVFYQWWGLLVMAVFFLVAAYCYVRARRAFRDFRASIAEDRKQQGIPRRFPRE